MILQKLKSRTGGIGRRVPLAEEVEALRRHDWSDPLFDEWCSSAARRLAPDTIETEDSNSKGAYCRLVSKVCI